MLIKMNTMTVEHDLSMHDAINLSSRIFKISYFLYSCLSVSKLLNLI